MVEVESPDNKGPHDPSSGLGLEAVRRQLDRILASPEFHATDKVRQFLRFVVEEKLAGRSHRIKGYTVAVAVFDRGEDFDASLDPIVRIQAGRLRRALERYYLVGGVHDPVLIDIPKGGYVPRFTSRKASTPAEPQPAAMPAAEATLDPQRVAVLPFENLTNQPEQTSLAVGLTEELVTELTRFQDLAVVPCQVARTPAEAPSDPMELARAVGARFVVQGSVRRDPETVKVSARLTDARDGRQVWADASSHPPEASTLIATQEEIAGNVVRAIASEYGTIAQRLSAESRKKAPAELETYEALLRYYSHQIAPTPESATGCFAALNSAVVREPEYGPAWSALATLHCQMFSFGVEGSTDALGVALNHARRGVSLDPGSQLAHMILAYASHLADDIETFHSEAETALSLNPNSPYIIGSIGYLRVLRGELDEGLPLVDRSIQVNPCHPAWFHAVYVLDHLLRGDDEAALAEARTHRPFIAFWDDVVQAAILARLGRLDEAREQVAAALAMRPDIEGRVDELLRRALKIQPLVDDLVIHLERAGLATGTAVPVASG
jgi:adenylate cyclase